MTLGAALRAAVQDHESCRERTASWYDEARVGLTRCSVKLQEPRGIMMSSLIEEPQPRRRRDEVMNYFGEKMGSSTSCEIDDSEKEPVHVFALLAVWAAHA
mmetsp:Transcript_173870/g.551997  ORF Transcript_173870/g.551997 Transcript_173870/m.551997 type:complete len:101 (-) Transcript_173870:123-425(-)